MGVRELIVDFNKKCGAVKPMHAVNNGPCHKHGEDQQISNLQWFIDAGIPCVRTHDASIDYMYGGEHIVDVHAIFPDFDKDPYDADSYDFACTDEYLRIINMSGAKVFYRLGSKIEHWVKKYGTLPPKDFHKWAVICEHIIRHYIEGWSDGFKYDIEYWEIWNEPDLDNDDSLNKRTWGGTAKEFFDLYEIAAKHIKSCFPKLKIGGPALAHSMNWAEAFLKEMKKRNVPIDFFSWHVYATAPEQILDRAKCVRKILAENGYDDSESILNEWNYVRGWNGEEWIYSLKAEKGLKGAAFTASVMLACQYESVDMLMYYDARPCRMNGLFDSDIPNERLKGYYVFKMFNELYKLGESVSVKCDEGIYACAAKNDKNAAVMITYYNDDDSCENVDVNIDLKSLGLDDGEYIKCYLLDNDNDMVLECEEKLNESGKITLNMPLFSSYLLVV